LTGGTTLNTFETPFGKIGLGICYDIVRELSLQKKEHSLMIQYFVQRFPEMAMIAARQGVVAMIYPSAFK